MHRMSVYRSAWALVACTALCVAVQASPAGKAWVPGGARVAKVSGAVQEVQWATVCEAAAAPLLSRLSTLPPETRHELRCVSEKRPAVQLPAGAVELKARLEGMSLVDGMRDQSVDVVLDGRLERSLRVTFQLTLFAKQWCAQSALPAGTAIDAQGFSICLVPVRHPDQLASVGLPLPPGRLGRALRANEALRDRDILSPDSGLSGEAVVVRYRAGALELESPGTLTRDTRPGELAWVRLSKGGEPVAGRLVAAHVVEMEVQP
jgi:hypothetical protein